MSEALKEAKRERRRRSVITLRIRGLSPQRIADALHVGYGTVVRDLEWIRQNWNEEYGGKPAVNAAQEIGEAVAVFADAEQAAVLEFHALAQTTSSLTQRSRARMACLSTMMQARRARIDLLQDLGLLKREIGSISASLSLTPRADELREALRKEGLLGNRVIDAEATVEGEAPEHLQKWLGTGA